MSMERKFTKKKITPEVIETFMNGRDPQKRIVNLEYSYRDNFIKVYYRSENDDKCVSEEPFLPFLWATRDACLKLCHGNRTKVVELLNKYNIACKALDTTNAEGKETCEEIKNGYRFMFYALAPMSYSKFLEFFKKADNPVYRDKNKNNNSFTVVGRSKKEERQYLTATPQEQFLISTGKRFFKGYDDYDQILRMIFDFETTGLDTKKDRIEQFGIRFNRPVKKPGSKEYIVFEKVFNTVGNTKEELDRSELENIDKMLRVIYTYRPDVITAHNGENFDWNIFINACIRLGTTIEQMSSKYFGGESIRKSERDSILKLGGEIETFNQTIVPGVIVTDSLHAVRRAQATNSNFLKADLKYSTKFLKLKKENRVYIPGNKISTIGNDTEEHYAFNDSDGDWYLYDKSAPDSSSEFKKGKEGDNPMVIYTRNFVADGYTLVSGTYIALRYLLDDLWECDKVEYTLNGADFMLCKIIPVTYQKCCTMGTASQWKAIMMAWSYENNLAIPLAENTGSFTGGLSRLLSVGFKKKVVKFDFNSLYPSIILTWAISDDNDLMNAMLYMLEYVLTTREKYKGLKKNAENEKEPYEIRMSSGEKLSKEEIDKYESLYHDFKVNDNLQMVVKKLGNSFFGSYGSNNGAVFPWKSVSCAERTICTGRQALRLMISHFNKLGYEPIVGDTDGFDFKLPEQSAYRYTDEHPYVSPGLSRETKKGKEYTYFKADVAEFNDLYMKDFHYAPNAVNKMGLGIDEVLESSINFSRKNYACYFPDLPYPDDVKLVGNTIKSKKMPEYIAKFLDKGVRLLLREKGQEFIEEYYSYIDKIYNYRIPLKEIASKGKIKKSIEEYIEDCKTLTKAGRPKSRQAWMELAIKEGVNVSLGDTIYYINTGEKKSQSDVKKVTHYYDKDSDLFGNGKKDVRVKLEKEYKQSENGKLAQEDVRPSFNEYVKKYHPEVLIEEEVIINCVLLPQEIVDSETDCFCEEGQEYNVPKYIEQFNNRIKPLLVCFNPDIRSKIIITNPKDRQYFTEEECKLDCGHPNKPGDQDTYEQLMSMDDKEIRFWLKHPEWKIPYLKECGMDWDKIVADYNERIKREKETGADLVKEQFEKALQAVSMEELNEFAEDGKLPSMIEKLVTVDPVTGNFVHKEYNDIVIGTINDIFDAIDDRIANSYTEEYEEVPSA